MKKTIALICSLVLVLLAGCGGSKTQSGGSGKFKGKQITYYGRWMEADEKWLAENVIAPFEREYGVTVTLKNFDVAADMLNILEMDKNSKTIGFFEVTPGSVPEQLVKAGLMAHAQDYIKDSDFIARFSDAGLVMSQVKGEQYFIPYNGAAYMTMYMKTPVQDAIQNWAGVKDAVSASLKKYNGYGLPEGYALESDPDEWDAYDLAVAGYYWANTAYNGIKAPRIAHRGRRYEATANEIVSKVYQMGGAENDVLDMDTQPVADAFAWESYYADAGIYIPEMWMEGWGGGNIYQAMADGVCFLAFMHTQDAFAVHGLGTPSLPGYLTNPDEMGLALMPLGTSLEIKDGKPARTGIRGSVVMGWLYGVPKTSPDLELSYELLKWVTKEEYGSHWLQTGMGVFTKQILNNLGTYLTEEWMVNVYDVIGKQMETAKLAPGVPQYEAISNIYLDAWYDIVVNKNNKDIAGTLKNVYGPKAAAEMK
jgi:maltose-binding protein MalE